MINYKIFNNQKRTAEKVLNSINLGNKRLHLVAPTQSGKTGSIVHLANIMPKRRILLTSGMMDNHLYNQNSFIAENAAKNIRSMKIHSLLKEPNPQYIIKKLNIEVIVIDENHYGIGCDSRLDKFIYKLSKKAPNVIIIWVGATGYQLVNSDVIDDTIQMDVPEKYFGASDVLNSKHFLHSDGFDYLNKLTSKERIEKGIDYGVVVNSEMRKVIEHFLSFKNGLGIVRVSTFASAEVLQESLQNRYPYFNILIASSRGEESISETVKNAQMIAEDKRVILIVIGGLKAGVDLSDTKEIVRFVIETYKTCAAVSQGLIGRMCGYHNNRSCMFVADKQAVQLQASFERDYRIINDEFLLEIFEEGSKRLGANFDLSNKYNSKKEEFYNGTAHKVNDISELNPDWFKEYHKGYFQKVKSLMENVLESNGDYRLKTTDHVTLKDKINTIQSRKFKNRKQFDSYIGKVNGRFNFTSVFHRFAFTSDGRKRGGLKGGVSNKKYAEAIKVGVMYDDLDKSFRIAIRDSYLTKREMHTNLNNRTIFNN